MNTAATWLRGPAATRTRFGEPLKYKGGLYRIAADTYAWMVPNGSWGETNLGLIDCRGTSVMIDTGWDLRCTREMLSACADITVRAPIEQVINTHADGDHCWGNQLFKGHPILATHACIHQMHHLQPRALNALYHGSSILRHLPVAGINQFGHYMHEMLRPYDFRGITMTDPTEGFSVQKTMNVKGVDIVITEVGPGHTDGDAVVYLPSRRVAYAGDILFVGVTPVMWSGPIDRLVAGLTFLKQLDVALIVPGHGPLATAAHVQDVLDYWHFVHEAIHARFKQGMPPARAAREVIFSPAFLRAPWARWDSPERLVTSAHTLYRHWGAPASSLPGQLAQMNLLRQQAMLAFDLPRATPLVMHQA
ncbi:MBL fold metallo-hydrolase [Aquabacterium sp.]|uniref:MBL fold metallo-hydrolase n=1 Tax=Aquabacterium sp. TaxID=1872578 RepID=UPI0040382A49